MYPLLVLGVVNPSRPAHIPRYTRFGKSCKEVSWKLYKKGAIWFGFGYNHSESVFIVKKQSFERYK